MPWKIETEDIDNLRFKQCKRFDFHNETKTKSQGLTI